jgi:hypothetical protein
MSDGVLIAELCREICELDHSAPNKASPIKYRLQGQEIASSPKFVSAG